MASAFVHLMILLALSQVSFPVGRPFPPPHPESGAEAPPQVVARLRMPPREMLAPARPSPPAPRPPEPQALKDRVSVGGPSELRQRGPLVLKPDEDLTRQVARGRPDAVPNAPAAPIGTPVPPLPDPVPEAPRVASGHPAAATGGLRLPEGMGPAQPAPARSPGTGGLGETIRNLDRRIAGGTLGTAAGTGEQMGPLFFDPAGADFTAWYNHFRTEVYRNWIVPPSVQMGARGHVDLEFVVHRDGRMSDLKLLKSAGTASLDRAAQNALLGSRLLPLPADFRPAQVAMQVSFFYNQPGHAS